jgi:hypothetical protein
MARVDEFWGLLWKQILKLIRRPYRGIIHVFARGDAFIKNDPDGGKLSAIRIAVRFEDLNSLRSATSRSCLPAITYFC